MQSSWIHKKFKATHVDKIPILIKDNYTVYIARIEILTSELYSSVVETRTRKPMVAGSIPVRVQIFSFNFIILINDLSFIFYYLYFKIDRINFWKLARNILIFIWFLKQAKVQKYEHYKLYMDLCMLRNIIAYFWWYFK